MALITLDQIQALPVAHGYGNNVELRWWYGRAFQDSSGATILGGTGSTGFYGSVPCTVNASGVTPNSNPEIYTTVDALDPNPQSIQFFARFFSNRTPKDWLTGTSGTPTGWIIYNPSPSTSITFSQLQLLNQSAYLQNPPQTFPTTQEMINYVNSVIGSTSYASVTHLGSVYTDVAPAIGAIPRVVGINSYASATRTSITKLSVDPVSSTNPVAIGPNDHDYPASFSTNPATWGKEENSGNPLFAVSSGDRAFENYTVATVRIGSDIWAYTKGTQQIHAYKSTNNGTSDTYMGVALSPGAGGSWDSNNVIEPKIWYDQANHTIHLYYKGRNASGANQIGHATASDSNPMVFTKDSANPILTPSTVQTALSFGGTVTDLGLGAVYQIGSTKQFTFYATDGTNWKVGRATATNWNTLSVQGTLAGFVVNTSRVTILQEVFKQPNANFYTGLFTEGSATIDSNPYSQRAIYVATSPDGITWTRLDPFGTFIKPTGGNSGWYARLAHHASILKDPEDANNLTPLLISGHYQVYFSGIDETGLLSQAGLMYVTPGVNSSAFPSLPAAASSMPAIRFYNTKGAVADASISTLDTPDAVTVMVIGENLFIAANGVYYRYSLASPYAALIMRQDTQSLVFSTTDAGGMNSYEPLTIDVSGVNIRGLSGTSGGVGNNAAILGLLRESNNAGVVLSMDNATNGLDVRNAVDQTLLLHADVGGGLASPSVGIGTATTNLNASAGASVLTVGGNAVGALEVQGIQTVDGNVGFLSFLNRVASSNYPLASVLAKRAGADDTGNLSFNVWNAGSPTEVFRLLPGGLAAQPEGAVLSVTSNAIAPLAPIHHVGAGEIQNITVPTEFRSGTIYLIPDAAFTYTNAGNIVGTGTAVIGRVMIAVYSSSSGKWYMSY